MIDEIIKVGTTSKIIEVWLADSSSSTGAGLTGLAFNSAGLTAYYSREDQGNVGATSISLATMTRGTWATAGFVEKDATGVPGVYQFSIPDAVLAAGAKWAKVYFKGATNLAPKVVHIALTAIDLYDVVRGGMTALPNAAAEAAGGLYTRGVGAGQINQTNNGQVDVNAARTGGTTNTARDIGAQLDATVSSRATQTSVDTIDDFVDTEVAAIKAKTDNLPADPADASDLLALLTVLQADTDDLQARLPAALTANGNLKTDVQRINGSATAAAQLALSAGTIVSGAAAAGTLSTTQMTTNLTEATDDHYQGRVIIWTSGVLVNQATDITAYAGATKMLTYSATTEAPSNGDTFVIV